MSSSGKVTTITSADIVNGTIVDADVHTAAAIGLAKLFHVGSGNVLRSNGAANVAGQITNGDIGDNQIEGVKLANITLDSTQFQRVVPTQAVHGNRLADNTVVTAALAANAVTQAFFQNSGGAMSSGVTGAWAGTGNNLALTGLTIGSKVVFWYTATAHHSVAGGALNVGLGLDSASAPTASTYVSANVAGYYTTLAFVGQFTVTATSHSLQETIYVSAATFTRAAGACLMAVELKR